MKSTRRKKKRTLDDLRLGVIQAAIRRSSRLIRRDFLWQEARYIVTRIDVESPKFVFANPTGGGPTIRVSANQVIELIATEQAMRAEDYNRHKHQELSEVEALF